MKIPRLSERFFSLSYPFVDSHTSVRPTSILTRLCRTFRYMMAGRAIGFTKNERDLQRFRNRHFGERVFILGNGPSLNRCDLTLLKNEFTFGVNNIFLIRDTFNFHPTYYVVEDTFVAEDRSEQIKKYTGPIKFFGNYLRYCLQDGPDTVWLNVRVNYGSYPEFPHFSQNAARMVWVGGTVSYICLQLAYYMGFSKIYLIGFDHSYSIPSDAKVSGTEIESVSNDPNHFNPDYFGKGYRWHDPMVDRMEKAYRKAKRHFEADGRTIFNATVGGKLEVFERVSYSSLFK